MNAATAFRRISAILGGFVLVATGCSQVRALSAHGGGAGTMGLTKANDDAAAGAHVGGLLHLGRDSGTAFGLDTEASGMVGSNVPTPRSRWRLEGLVGHVWAPLPHRAPVGFELFAHAGFGRFPARDRNSEALVLGPRLGLPIRFERSTPIWDAERPIWATAMLVPSLGTSFYLPVGSEVDSSPRSELTAHLTLRLYVWSSLMP